MGYAPGKVVGVSSQRRFVESYSEMDRRKSRDRLQRIIDAAVFEGGIGPATAHELVAMPQGCAEEFAHVIRGGVIERRELIENQRAGSVEQCPRDERPLRLVTEITTFWQSRRFDADGPHSGKPLEEGSGVIDLPPFGNS